MSTLKYYLSQTFIVCMLLFNWNAVCSSFGFGEMYSFSGQHPFQVIVLILGGALDPLYDVIYVSINAITRTSESKAGKSHLSQNLFHH